MLIDEEEGLVLDVDDSDSELVEVLVLLVLIDDELTTLDDEVEIELVLIDEDEGLVLDVDEVELSEVLD